MALFWILLAIVVLVGLWLVVTYNSLVTSRNRVDEAWSDIEVQMKRRFDLIPNLIETVKGYAQHEKSVLENVTSARSKALSATTPHDMAAADTMLTASLRSVFAISENYPNLQAVTSFVELQRELADAENKIQAARRFYNANVRDFNTKLQVFPTNLIGNTLGFKARELFDAPDEVATPPQVRF